MFFAGEGEDSGATSGGSSGTNSTSAWESLVLDRAEPRQHREQTSAVRGGGSSAIDRSRSSAATDGEESEGRPVIDASVKVKSLR